MTPNEQYLAQLPIFLASALGDVLVGMQFADFAWRGKGAKADGTGKEWLSTSGKVCRCPRLFVCCCFFRLFSCLELGLVEFFSSSHTAREISCVL